MAHITSLRVRLTCACGAMIRLTTRVGKKNVEDAITGEARKYSWESNGVDRQYDRCPTCRRKDMEELSQTVR